MIIGGWQKVSLIDYPGKVSCVLFVSGCNFNCPYCHNPQLVKRGRLRSFFIDEQTVYDYLDNRKGLLDGVVISGGEPTIHQELIYLCKKVKKIGYPIKLDTNGSRPKVIKQLIEKDLIDYIAMDKIQLVIDRRKLQTQLQAETKAGRILQNLVYKNFLHSKMECLRHTRFSIRYAWNVKGSVVYLWYPSHMTARKFREWLEENVKDFDSKNPKEKERIQTLINRDLEWGYHISMDGCENFNALGVAMAHDHSPIESNESIMFVNKLADDVARKKVRNIRRLRPGIKKLGARNIETLILRIFSDLSQGDYKAARIAELYGISKATLSRFAGNNWFGKKRDNDDFQIPDLWRNTAGILAGNPDYMEIVLASGVAGKLEKILEFIEPLKEKPNA